MANRLLPKVGFLGFTKHEVAVGGQRAGFHYFVATGKVEFSPLSWYEVRDAVENNLTPDDRLPDCVVKVFIVRPREKPYEKERHCWESLASDLEMPDNDEQYDMHYYIWKLWLFTIWRFNKRTFVPQKMRLDPPTPEKLSGQRLGV